MKKNTKMITLGSMALIGVGAYMMMKNKNNMKNNKYKSYYEKI